MGEYLDWQIRRGGCCSEIHRTKPWGTATYKEQFHPHHKDMAASKGKGEESFLHGCNWDLGEAEMEMALGEIFFLARLFWLTFILGKPVSVGELPNTQRTIASFHVGLGDTRLDSATGRLIPYVSNSQQKAENLSL